MTADPDHPILAAASGRSAVAGTEVSVRWEVGADGVEVALEGALDRTGDAEVDAVAAVIRSVAAAHPDQRLLLITDHGPAGPPPAAPLVAAAAGLQPWRELHQLRRPLPVPPNDPGRANVPAIALRPFLVGRDEEAWVRVNHAAFAAHPSQGDQDRASLERTLAEPWVDLDGFLVSDDLDRPGELAGFCWTRVHPATNVDPVLGEIFVIGVAPERHGHLLGAALVLAGLDHLAWVGAGTAMLYVEGDNAPARRLYERLGFSAHHIRRIDA